MIDNFTFRNKEASKTDKHRSVEVIGKINYWRNGRKAYSETGNKATKDSERISEKQGNTKGRDE
jgi:hypothetical protein